MTMTVKISDPQMTLENGRTITLVIAAMTALEFDADLSEAIETLTQMRQWHRLENGLSNPGDQVQRLTPREYEVVELLARGKEPKEIAKALQVSRNTVRAHTKSIYAKLGIHSRVGLVLALNGGHKGR